MCRSIVFTALAIVIPASTVSAAPPSGMLLGVYAFENWQGLRITGTIPGYSAHGKLFRNDVLLGVTTDGLTVYPTKSLSQIERAKDMIGPFTPAALEVWRPGFGYEYFWVEFRPVGGVAARAHGQKAQMKARIMTEKEKPGARASASLKGVQS